MLFVECDHVGRAHASVHLSTGALAIALLGGTGQTTVGTEIEVGRERERPRIQAEAQVMAERGRVNDLAGVEQPFRIESLLDLAEGLRETRTKHALRENTAQN